MACICYIYAYDVIFHIRNVICILSKYGNNGMGIIMYYIFTTAKLIISNWNICKNRLKGTDNLLSACIIRTGMCLGSSLFIAINSPSPQRKEPLTIAATS